MYYEIITRLDFDRRKSESTKIIDLIKKMGTSSSFLKKKKKNPTLEKADASARQFLVQPGLLPP